MKRKLLLTGYVGIAIFVVLFGTSILNNLHNGYIRLLGSGVIRLTNSTGQSGATGFIIKGNSGKKYIMTNGHVCGLAENGVLTAEYRGEKFPVFVVKQYEWNDLCALEAHRPLGFAVNVASSVSFGESTFVIGHPLLEPKTINSGELSADVSIMIITKQNPGPRECEGPTYRRIDVSGSLYGFFGINELCARYLDANASTMSIQPGNSGSPAVNIYGSVVAVAFAANESGTRSYFVPLADLKDFLGEL